MKRVWDVVGKEARLRGMHMCHSPEADIVRDPRFGRMSEAFGEDTFLTSQMIKSAITGVQGDYDGLGNGTHIGAVAKHFAGYGQVSGGRNFASVNISPRTLIDEIYPPFEIAVREAHTLGIMASHGDLNGIASHGNPELLTGVLRKQWGFDGYVVSDANDIGRLFYFMKVASSPEDAALMALEAGVDVDLYAEDAYALLPEMATKNPKIMEWIDRSAGRVLRTKFILGLFENPYVDLHKVNQGVRASTSLDLAQQADLESIILLKNDEILPLSKNRPTKIALLGPLLSDSTKDEFEKVAGKNIQFSAYSGPSLTDEDPAIPKLLPHQPDQLNKMLSIATMADLVILFLGGDEFTAKEAYFNNAVGDRATIEMVGHQNELLDRVKELGKPVVVILKHRRTLEINNVAAKANAILDIWDLSERGEMATAQILFGEVSPSGKLPVTVPRSIGQLPFHYSQREIDSKKGYLFMDDGPLYPFGHGLTYAPISYENLVISKSILREDSSIEITVELTNKGTIPVKETVQLYIKDQIRSVLAPEKELKAFQKIDLYPGEKKEVRFRIHSDMLLFTGINMKKQLEDGDYTILVGTSSNTGLEGTFQLIKDKNK